MQEALEAQARDFTEKIQRHLAFIDRLLADKDGLARQASQLSAQLKVAHFIIDDGQMMEPPCLFGYHLPIWDRGFQIYLLLDWLQHLPPHQLINSASVTAYLEN